MNEKPTHLDLFSGIGGFSLAFEAEGFKTIGFAEIAPYASAVLKKHWPSVPNYGDVRNIPRTSCDVITGGFPCQPFSSSGLKRGKADNRFLWPAMRDIIQECQPAWVCCENVAGIINMALDEILDDLASIEHEAQTFVIPACAVGGPHYRDRVWILSNSLRWRPKMGGHMAGIRRMQEQDQTHSVWPITGEPPILGVHARIPKRLHRPRCRALGNAIVPQIAQIFARAIYQQIKCENSNPA